MEIHVERSRQKQHGDFSTNVALSLSKSANCGPRDLAQQICDQLPLSASVERTEIAGPGFINFFLTRAALYGVLTTIKDEGDHYGHCNVGAKRRVMVEFVSANPTGPLHVGHGRGAAFGDTLVRVLVANGFDVASEYYVNDAGRQMDVLTVSVWLRYIELCGETFSFPDNAYRGDYVLEIAAALHRKAGESLRHSAQQALVNLTDGDPEVALDSLISRIKNLLGADAYGDIYRLATDTLAEDIRSELADFGVHYDVWFSERSLADSGAIERTLDQLRHNGHLYQQAGAWWFRSTRFGDEKDRVVIRSNGDHTYFASDAAYHLNKVERGFDTLVDIWGADHHGHVRRIKAAFEALGKDPDGLRIVLVQFVSLYSGGEKVTMSTRGGEFVTLRELRDEVGNDAARFFYILRKPEQHMDFDLDLAKSQSNDNPVYYIQYAHARICSVFRQLQNKCPDLCNDHDTDFETLQEDHEMDLLNTLARFPEIVASAGSDHEPHQIAYYLRDLATRFHTYYNAYPFLSAEPKVRDARLGLIDGVRQVIANGLSLLGVSAPETM